MYFFIFIVVYDFHYRARKWRRCHQPRLAFWLQRCLESFRFAAIPLRFPLQLQIEMRHLSITLSVPYATYHICIYIYFAIGSRLHLCMLDKSHVVEAPTLSHPQWSCEMIITSSSNHSSSSNPSFRSQIDNPHPKMTNAKLASLSSPNRSFNLARALLLPALGFSFARVLCWDRWIKWINMIFILMYHSTCQ